MPRRAKLGSADDTHLHQAERAVIDAERTIGNVERAARQGKCRRALDQLVVAQANLSHANAHLESLSGSGGTRARDFRARQRELQQRLLELKGKIERGCLIR